MTQSLNLNELKNINMQDENWTVYDKLAMYRGLVKIYNRERGNQVHDFQVLKKQNYKNITRLKEEVKSLRETVDSTQKESNVAAYLQDNKELQLALFNSGPQETKKSISRKMYDRRSHLDELRFQNSVAEKDLEKYQIELDSLINDNIDHDFKEKDRRLVVNSQIQEFKAKVIAGRNIQELYGQMMSLLRKDQRYYSAVLESLKENARLQQLCIIRATEMGQLATEEVANMRVEYQRREHDVRLNMEIQMNTIKDMENQLESLWDETQTLIRADSMHGLIPNSSESSIETESELEKQVSELNTLLKRMQNAILVPEFNDIFPRMLEQLKQNEKLFEDLNDNETKFELLLKKINHGHLILTAIINQAEGNNTMFMIDRETILKTINDNEIELHKIGKDQNDAGSLLVQLRDGLSRLWNILSPTVTHEEIAKEIDVPEHPGATLIFKDVKATALGEILDKTLRQDEREKMLYAQVRRRARFQSDEEDDKATHQVSFNLDPEVEDPAIPSRADIKSESKKIVDIVTTSSSEVLEMKNPSKKTVLRKKL